MKPDPFCRGGDSGSVIVDAEGNLVTLLTSGTGPTYSPDVTYGLPICWLWEIIEVHFPGVTLNFAEEDRI